jgi:hypothetical protein
MPTNIYGNLMGKIIASYKVFLAFSRPATSDHFTLGFSFTIASVSPFFNASSSLLSFLMGDSLSLVSGFYLIVDFSFYYCSGNDYFII